MDKTCQFDRLWAKVGPTTHSARHFARKMPNNIPIESFFFDFTCVKRLYLGSSDQAFQTNKTGRKHVSTTMEQKKWLLVSQVNKIDEWSMFLAKAVTHRIHGAAIYGVPWIPSILTPFMLPYIAAPWSIWDVSSTFGPKSIWGQLLRGLRDRWLAGKWLVWTGGDPWIPTPWVAIFSFLNGGIGGGNFWLVFNQIPKISQVPSAVWLVKMVKISAECGKTMVSLGIIG